MKQFLFLLLLLSPLIAYADYYDYQNDQRYLCTLDEEDQSSGCAGELAALRPGWGSSSLSSACSGNDAYCIVGVAALRPGWSSSSLSSACGSCIVKLAEERPGWSSSSLNNACQ